MVHYDMLRDYKLGHIKMRYSPTVQYGTEQYGTLRYDIIWYDTIGHDMNRC